MLETTSQLPSFFGPILWSYEISKIDIKKDKKTIVVQAINYGDLRHWRWIARQYGAGEVRRILSEVPVTELRPRVRRLAALIFGITHWNDAPRGAR